MSDRERRHITDRAVAAALILVSAAAFSACGSDDRPAAAEESDESPPASAVETSSGGYTADAEGSGSVTYDGIQYDNFTGDCEISRRHGREDVGDLATPGLSVIVGVDNTRSAPEMEMNFIAITDTSFRVTTHRAGQPANRQRGTLAGLAYGSALTPVGSSQALALVEFSGQTADGVPVLAQLVCEIQNEFK